jgi:hypothetical protein
MLAAAALAAASLVAAGCAAEQTRTVQRASVRRAAPLPPPPPSTYVPWGEHSVWTRVGEIGTRARARLRPRFEAAGVSYPPASVELVAFKRERRLEIWAGPSPHSLARIDSVEIQAASGGPGPKLREGDRQVPEGIYRVEALQPNSLYHVALRLAYPNTFDVEMASRDRRRRLGGDIMIHGSDRSIGCIAVGDVASEDLFVLAADAGIDAVSVVIVPRDFRRTGERSTMPGQPPWVADLYADLDRRLRELSPTQTVFARGPAATVRYVENPDGSFRPAGTSPSSSRSATGN